MILVQKPLSIHRRHPSAPSPVVVQSTRTPGLLTLSKPLQQQQQQRLRYSPKSKQPIPRTPARSQQQENVILKPSPEIADKKPVTASPAEKAQARGRHPYKSKEKPTTRSSSHSVVRGRRNNARQPSPPLPVALTSQAEASPSPYKFSSSNLFDPFMDDSPSARPKPVRLPPTLVARPSGKLAKRRLPNSTSNPAPTPASSPAKAVPVPRRNNSSNAIMSRSAPGPNHFHHRSAVKGSSEPSDVFPICDDVSEAGDFTDSECFGTPRTPTRPRTSTFLHGFDDGPRTAPITASIKIFPFNTGRSPTPAPAKKGKRHARVPSEGVFAMSSDEEASTGGVGSPESKPMNTLLCRRRPTVSMTELEEERAAAAAAAAAYFASSNFQNSPSPEELPPPSFV
ncbi:hypothetical protein E1B28_006172 [Marasmius oreades]|uniref:Uncharacterized protein n=1 Tax=Marasmius oreades TaxID=181124 RepID=A0A9P7S569_9AGAR|nr:uncharacterized protein E1B28_006172 [Marasmius oreades]KAG7095423.1 hypothetical protein E1B28_006172 [Marasmius oreades]